MLATTRTTQGPKQALHPVADRDTAIWLGGLLLVALILRLIALNAGLWLDEMLTNVLYARQPLAQILSTYDSENQHLLYSVLARLSFLGFGESAWALRLPAVLFGVASLAALYAFGRHVAGRREALLATALLTFSYHHVWFSQNARGYTGLLFWTLLSSWLLLRAFEVPSVTRWLQFAGAAALGVFTHLTMLFVIAGQGAAYFLHILLSPGGRREDRGRGLLAGFAGAGVATVILHAPVLPKVLHTVQHETSAATALWQNPLWTVMEALRVLQVGALGGAFLVAGAVLVGAGLISYAKERPVVIELLLLPALLGAAVVVGMGHHLWPRFFFFAAGFGALVVVRGGLVLGRALGRLLRLADRQRERLALMAPVGMIVLSAASVPLAYGPKQDYRAALDYVESHRAPGDAVAVVGIAVFPYTRYYHTDWTEVADSAQVDALRAHASRAHRS